MSTLYKYQTQGGQAVTYLDPDDTYKPEDIRRHWAETFPELAQATTATDDKAQTVEVEGQPVEVTRIVSFAKKVGTKGDGQAAEVVRWDQVCQKCQTGIPHLTVMEGKLVRVCPACGDETDAPIDAQLRRAGALTLFDVERYQ